MPEFESRPFGGAADLALLIAFARSASAARLPGLSYWHVGDIVWQLFPFSHLPVVEDVRLWSDSEGLAGFVLFEPPLNCTFDVRPGIPADGELLDGMLAWAEERRRHHARPGETVPRAYAMLGEGTLATVSFESDTGRRAALERRGYLLSGERHNVRYSQHLDHEIPPAPLPPGYRLRHATDADIEARAELHRDAWSTWGTSAFSAKRYARLRMAPVYAPELDVVLEAPDGQLVSYCIAWADPESGVGTFEPVGTRPAAARRGFGRAVVLEGLRRLRDRGLHTALIGTASVNAPALALYPSCGFALAGRECYYVKEMTPPSTARTY